MLQKIENYLMKSLKNVVFQDLQVELYLQQKKLRKLLTD